MDDQEGDGTMIYAFLIAAMLVVGSILLIARELRVHTLNVRVTKAIMGDSGQSSASEGMMAWLSSFGMRYRRFYSAENLEQLRTVVRTSGFNPHRVMPIIIAGKTLSMLLFPIAAVIATGFSGASLNDRLLYIALATVVGIMGPRLLLRFMSRRFKAAVDHGTPDAIDLLIVCSEAGMGLESGLERVAQETARSNQALSKVLYWLLDDLRVLPNRRDAFANLATRSTSDGLRRFGTMINQSMQYGTPLNQALRAIAEELRRERLTRLEEKATKLGAKMIIPMVIFMLPAMFVILAGSPFLHLMESIKMISQ
jgi:tight adherence protein C